MAYGKEVRIQAKLLRRAGFTYQEIADRLNISKRTVEGWKLGGVKGDAWTLPNSNPEDAGLILNFLAHAIKISGGRRTSITNDEADLAIRIHRARPSLPLDKLWYMTGMYQLLLEEGRDVGYLDAQLALWPDLESGDNEARTEAEAIVLEKWFLKMPTMFPIYGHDSERKLEERLRMLTKKYPTIENSEDLAKVYRAEYKANKGDSCDG